MNKLNVLKSEVFDYCKEKFILFDSKPPLEQVLNSYIDFGSEDWKNFIDIAKKLDINMLYYYQDSGIEAHSNEIGLIQIGFIYSEVFHIFSKSENWYTKLMFNEEDEDYNDEEYVNENSVVVDKEEILKIIKTPATEMLESILSFLKETGKAIPSYDVSFLLDDYFLYRYNFRYRSISNNMSFFKSLKLNSDIAKEFIVKMQQVIKLLEGKRREIERKKLEDDLKIDDEILKTLVPECVEWARNNSLPKLNKSNVYHFCILKNSKLSDTGIDRLYILVNKELKMRGID